MRYLGIDYGSKHIGLAVGDSELKLAMPFEMITNDGHEALFAALGRIVADHQADAVVVGLPELGTERTSQRDTTLDFAKSLQEYLDLPVHMVDESFSSKEAQARLREVGSDEGDHAVAAMLILQTYFDKHLRD